MRSALLMLSLVVVMSSFAEDKKPVKCLNVSEWINSCVDRVSKGEAEHRATLVDIRFLGKKMPPMTDRWIRDNSESILDAKDKMDFSKESSRTIQDGCTKISSKEGENSLTMKIEKSDETFVEVSLHDAKTENPEDSGFVQLILRDYRIRMTKKSDEVLLVTMREPKDGRLLETDQLIRCEATLPAEDTASPGLKAFQEKAAAIKADSSGVKDDPKDLAEFAFVGRSGEPAYFANNSAAHKAEYQTAFEAFAKDKNKVVKDLSVTEHMALYIEFIKAKGKTLSPEALFAFYRECTFNRLLATPKNEAELIEEKPELKKTFADMRAGLKNVQKEIAQLLDMPDYYWDYVDLPNSVLNSVGEAIGGAIGSAIEQLIGPPAAPKP